MEFVALGKTNCMVSRPSFWVKDLQNETDMDNAIALLRNAYERGINFFLSSPAYGLCEKQLGYAFYGMRRDVFIASVSFAKTSAELHLQLAESLDNLQGDYVDLYFVSVPDFVPGPGSKDGMYDALRSAKADGVIHSIGFFAQSAETALEAYNSHLYDVVACPFNALSDEGPEGDVSFVAYDITAAGTVESLPLAYGFVNSRENAVPVWNVKNREDLDKLLYFESHPPVIDESFRDEVLSLRQKQSESESE